MARSRAPHIRGTILCLAAGIAFSVSPVLVQVAYAHGAAVSGVLAWRYLVAALLLAGIAGRRLLRVPPRAAIAAFALGAARLRARFRPLLRLARAHLGAARVPPPLRPPGARRRRRRPGRPRAAHAAAPVRPDRDLRRGRPRRRRGGEPRCARDPDGARLGGRLRGLHPPVRPTPPRRRPDGTDRAPHRGRLDVLPRRRCRHRDTRHGRWPRGPRLPRRRCARRLGLRRQLVPQGRPPRRPVDGLAPRHRRGARHDRARRPRAEAAPDARRSSREPRSSSVRSSRCS